MPRAGLGFQAAEDFIIRVSPGLRPRLSHTEAGAGCRVPGAGREEGGIRRTRKWEDRRQRPASPSHSCLGTPPSAKGKE